MKLNEKIKNAFQNEKDALKTRTVKAGSYNITLTAVFLAILIVANVLVSSLPSSWTNFDISAQQLYSLSSNTKVVLSGNEKDVTIYWVSQKSEKDTVIAKLLDQYTAYSDRITVIDKDPDAYPTFVSQYYSGTVYNNSLIVECDDKYRYIDYYDIYLYDTSDYYTSGTISTSFDGEGAITSAIDYVISEDLPQLYVLSGHGESDLSESLSELLEKENIETVSFSLLNVDEISDEADCVLINAPTTDISENEKDMLADYVAGGGKLLVINGPKEGGNLTNMEALLNEYGVSMNEGIIIEGDRNSYAFSYPYILLPEIESHDITDPIIEDGYYIIAPIAGGLTISSSASNVTSLLSTSDSSFSKIAGFELTTYDKEENDIDGPFSLAVAIESGSNDGKVVWISSDYLLEDTYNSYSSGANLDLAMNSISWMIGESESVSIRSKSMDYSYLTISETQSTYLKAVMIGAIPLLYLLYGVDEALKRRKK